jgi:hypothetical protein
MSDPWKGRTMKKVVELSEWVRLNRLAKAIDQESVEVQAYNDFDFQIILYGARGNLIFIGDFPSCQAYLFGIRDARTVAT